MKTLNFRIKKWVARALMTIGAALGVTSCINNKPASGPMEAVYGPPPGDPDIEVVEDVYGPPIESPDSDIVNDNVVAEPDSATKR